MENMSATARRRIFPKRTVKAVDGATIGPRNGSCGTAMFTRKPVIVEDVMTDPLWADYREFARICGLSACWSTPILSPQGEVLGSFAMYREEKRGPRPEEDRLTEYRNARRWNRDWASAAAGNFTRTRCPN